jgi:hypothetical protein
MLADHGRAADIVVARQALFGVIYQVSIMRTGGIWGLWAVFGCFSTIR